MANESFPITLADVHAARGRIRDAVYYSPLARSETLSQRFGCHLYLKLENLQMSGSFKERGALNRLLQLTPDELKAGLVVASAGNHAQGVAYHGTRLGAPVTVVMPMDAPLTKVRATRRFGAEVVLYGATVDEALAEARRRCAANGATFIHPYEDPPVIAGQGTIGLEILDQCPQVDTIVVPVGGGGLIGGIAVAVHGLKPEVRMLGAEASAIPAGRAALQLGRPVEVAPASSIADGIAVRQLGANTFPIVQHLVNDIVTVDEDEIAAAILVLLEDEKTVAEGAGAAPLAAIMHHDLDVANHHVVLVVSGGNIDVSLLSSIIGLGEVKRGRLLEARVRLRDQPGQLRRLSALLADLRANIVQIHHVRSVEGLRIGEVLVDLQLETRDFDHIAEVRAALESAGYDFARPVGLSGV